MILDLEQNTNSISARIINDILPEDVKIKGYHMAEVYTYLYSVENSLRLFIEKVCKEKYGESYFLKLLYQELYRTLYKLEKITQKTRNG